jgi:hypothetical protein
MAAETGGSSYALPAVSWNVTEPPPAEPPHWYMLASSLGSSQGVNVRQSLAQDPLRMRGCSVAPIQEQRVDQVGPH